MSTAPVPARRSFLRSIAAVVATAPAATVAAVPAAVATALPVESPALLAIGKRLADIDGAYDTAAAAEASSIAEFERLKPALPADLIAHPDDTREVTRGVPRPDGGWILREDGGGPVQVFDAELLEDYMARNGIDGRTKVGRRVRRLIRLARAYEADIADAKRLSRVDSRRWAAGEFTIEVQDLFDELLAFAPRTTAGHRIYARAIMVGNKVLRYGGQPSQVERAGASLAAALLRFDSGR